MPRLGVISLIIALIFLGGCARTVTQIINYGDELTVEVTLRGDFDIVNNRYFMVISSQEAFKIPLPPPDSLDEFVEPGDTPQLGNTAYYYANYYSTWDSFIVLDDLGYALFNGPFVSSTEAITREAIAGLGDVSSKISFNVRLERIYGSSVPNPIYFDLITVSYPADSGKTLKDHISPPTRSISNLKGARESDSDDENPDIDPSLDILSWIVIIQ